MINDELCILRTDMRNVDLWREAIYSLDNVSVPISGFRDVSFSNT